MCSRTPSSKEVRHAVDASRSRCAGAGFVTSATDWLFAGDWIHRRWTHREVWRPGEGCAIALTAPLPFLTCGVFAYAALRLGLHTTISLARLAIAVWLIGPLPLILANAAFITLHRMFVMFNALGWLIKLLIVAMTVSLVLK
jgi:hypothetical protein